MKGLKIMADKGWIKLNRQIQDNELWLEDVPFNRRDAWIDLLLMANVSTKTIVYKGNAIKIERGQVYTSIRKLAEKWHWGKDKTLRYIRLLEKLGMIERDSETEGATLLTIVKYGFFQDGRDRDKDTDKDTNKDRRKDTDKPLLKNVKNDKRNKEVSDCVPHYSDDPERNAEIIREMARGAILLPDGKLDYSNVKHSWEI